MLFRSLAFSQKAPNSEPIGSDWATYGRSLYADKALGSSILFGGGYLDGPNGSYTVGGNLTLGSGVGNGAGVFDGSINFKTGSTLMARMSGGVFSVNRINRFSGGSHFLDLAATSTGTSLNVLGKLVASDVNLIGGNSTFKSGTTPLVDIKTALTEIFNPLKVNGNVNFVGNVGIGTTANAAFKLDVNGTIRTTEIALSNNNAGNRLLWARTDGTHKTGLTSDGFSNLMVLTNNVERMRINTNGEVGIGIAPVTGIALNVKGTIQSTDIKTTGVGKFNGNGTSIVKWGNPNVGWTNNAIAMNGIRESDVWTLYGDGARSSIGLITTDIFSNMRFVTHHDNTIKTGKTLSDEELINNNTKLIILENGNVGIGVPTPQAKLHVAGTIRATEIQVLTASVSDLNVNGDIHANNIRIATNGQTADFVFEPTYQLRPLAEVENFILENKHLPEIPSATQMEADGVNLAEMNKLLLMKVEELTLYVIQQQKQINQLMEKK